MKTKNIFLLLSLLILSMGLVCGSAFADDNNSMDTTHPVDTTDYTQQNSGVLFNDTTVDNAQNFQVVKTNDTIKVSMLPNAPEEHTQVIGIPLSQMPDFSGTLEIDHFNDSGVCDYTNIVDPYVINDVAYVNVSFSTVTIQPYVSFINNWDFERWDFGTSNAAPDGWALVTNGQFRSSDAKFGSYSYGINGCGIGSVTGYSYQDTAITPGYYTLDAWIKTSGITTGSVTIDICGGSPSVDSTGITVQQNTAGWAHYTYREYINSTSPTVRLVAAGNVGSTYLVDGLILSKDNSNLATETSDDTHLYQTFTYAPSQVYTESTIVTSFKNYNLSQYTVTGVSVTIDGSAVTSYYTNGEVYVDAFGLGASPHTVAITLTNNPLPPIVSFTQTGVATPGQAGVEMQFNDTSSNNVTSWLWDFGDGNTSTQQNPVHIYGSKGTYNVKLSVSGSGGAGSITQTVDVEIVAPRNYGQYVKRVFKANMTSWDFMSNINSVYTSSIPDGIWYLILWLIPMISMYNRQGSLLLISVLYCFTGMFAAIVLPAFWGGSLFWMMVLGGAGIIYRLFIPE